MVPVLPALAAPGAIGGSWVTPAASGPAADAAICAREIMREAPGSGVDAAMALSVGLTESGRRVEDGRVVIWPWTVNAEGEGRRFDSKAEAVEWVRRAIAAGMRSIDVGCMQVNLRWHPDAFDSLEAAFDPKANVAYALGHLGELSRQYGPRLGVGRYHSATAEYQERYLARIDHNLGYVEEMRRRVQAAPPGIEPGGWGEAVLGGIAFTRGLIADTAPQPLLPTGFVE
ncbi:lytic transglycosylase domain-containing protein [Inquilinus limosus]|uniref:lytic transglycosylase domain-containing protein n=1 Tax=Inquilinus limosus TaxID=171674 RepID=UPI003F13BD51